jgi:hypothetical protein
VIEGGQLVGRGFIVIQSKKADSRTLSVRSENLTHSSAFGKMFTASKLFVGQRGMEESSGTG